MAPMLSAIVPNTIDQLRHVDRHGAPENFVGVEADKKSEEIHLAPLPLVLVRAPRRMVC